mgnify:CR=1 FL=1
MVTLPPIVRRAPEVTWKLLHARSNAKIVTWLAKVRMPSTRARSWSALCHPPPVVLECLRGFAKHRFGRFPTRNIIIHLNDRGRTAYADRVPSPVGFVLERVGHSQGAYVPSTLIQCPTRTRI